MASHLIHPPNVDELVERAVELPAMPAIGTRLVQHLQEPSASAESVSRIIEVDVSLTAHILAVANSAAYAGTRRVISIQQAVTRLGMRATTSIALGLASKALLKSVGKLERALWTHSVACAAAAQLIASRLAPALRGEAFAAGLLHDVGKYALASAQPEVYAAVHASGKRGAPGCELEAQAFGVAHTDVGGVLLERWQLPELLSSVASMHHDLPLGRMAAPTDGGMIEVVSLADALVHDLESGESTMVEQALVDLDIISVNEETLTSLRQSLGTVIAEQQRVLAG